MITQPIEQIAHIIKCLNCGHAGAIKRINGIMPGSNGSIQIKGKAYATYGSHNCQDGEIGTNIASFGE